ncbi:reverse transcriptase domain-containing protein [Tanacetum coccineum]
MQSLSGKLAALNRFLSRSVERALPFFDTLKNITKENKDDFCWTEEAEQAFQELKAVIMELPTLTTPNLKEILCMYLAASGEAVSEVLMADRRGNKHQFGTSAGRSMKQEKKLHLIGKAGTMSVTPFSEEAEQAFQELKAVIMELPTLTTPSLKETLYVYPAASGEAIINKSEASGKLAKYAVELGAYNITYMPQNGVKGQVLAAFLNEAPVETGQLEIYSLADDKKRRYLVEGRERSKGPADEDRPIRDRRRNFVQEVVSVSNAKMRRFGLPRVIVTDNGTQLVNDLFKGWCEKWKIKQMNTAVAHPQANGLVKRANKSLMLGLKARLGRERVGWVDELPNILNEASHVENQGKLGPNWEGPYRVVEAYENGSYKLGVDFGQYHRSAQWRSPESLSRGEE